MDVIFDTEFSSLEKRNGHRYLISIGCVADDGREFYAELVDTWDESLCSFFTIQNVLPQLEGGARAMEVGELAFRLKKWIEGTNEQVTLISDAPELDWPFVQNIFNIHGWPKNLNKECGSVPRYEAIRCRFDAAVAEYWIANKDIGAAPHHALWDARCNRFALKESLST